MKLTDSTGITTDKLFTLTLAAANALTLNTTTLPQGYIGTSYSTTLSASGGVPTRTYSITGTLPTGLSFNNTSGVISGTPSVAGLTNLTFTVTDYSYPTAQIVSGVIPLRIWPILNGACGTSSGGTFTVIPSTELCNSGTASAITGTGPWNWTCTGSTGGTTATCNASIQTYTVSTIITGGNGTVSCTSPINNGATSTCTITPANGYQIATFTDNSVDKIGVFANGSYSVTGVTIDHAIAATFSLIPPSPVSGACGTSNGGIFAIAPTTNFCATGTTTAVTGTGPWNWTCDGSNGGTTATCNASIQAYTVSGNVTGGNGTVSCTSPVNSGATAACTVTPANGYQVATFTDNSANKTGAITGGSYSITGVSANHAIAATFSLIPPTPISGTCGISNNGTYTIVPTTNFCTTGTATAVTGTGPWSWTCNGSNGGTTSTCNASIQTYTVSANVTGGNGTVSCTSPVNSGAASSCTATPATGYQVATFTDNSIDKTGAVTGGGYSITGVSANHTIAATFSLIPLTPVSGACGASNNGTFANLPAANFCTTGTASSITGSGPWSWACAGSNGGTTASCNASIATFTVTPSTNTNYTITPATPQTVTNNTTTTFTVTPTSGYGVVVTGCGGSLNGTAYTTGTITANCTISVIAVARNAGSGGVAQPPTITDALKVLQAVVGITALTPAEQIRYDVAPLGSSGNPVGNGTLDAADVILILRRSIGIGSW